MNRANDVPKKIEITAAKLDVNTYPFETRKYVNIGDMTADEPPKVKLRTPEISPFFSGNSLWKMVRHGI